MTGAGISMSPALPQGHETSARWKIQRSQAVVPGDT